MAMVSSTQTEMYMTAEEFMEQYAQASGTTVEKLKALGQGPLLCRCGDKGCMGWAVVNVLDALAVKTHKELYGTKGEE